MGDQGIDYADSRFQTYRQKNSRSGFKSCSSWQEALALLQDSVNGSGEFVLMNGIASLDEFCEEVGRDENKTVS